MLSRFFRKCFLLPSLFFLLTDLAVAADFYVDPVNGSPGGDGSSANPWRTLEEVVDAGLIETQTWESFPYAAGASLVPVNSGAPVKAGDTIYLRTGYHGEFNTAAWHNASPIIIAADAGHGPRLRRISLSGGSNWVFRGLSISLAHAPTYSKSTLVHFDNHGWRGPVYDVVIEDCDIRSVQSAEQWQPADWLAKAGVGIVSDGERMTIKGNHLENISFGITVSGAHTLVERNTIKNFSGDGIRGLGDYGKFYFNHVENALKVDDNHDDGFQSWSYGPSGVGSGVVRGVELIGNLFINSRDPVNAASAPFQGIGCFDGFFDGWVIENNVVIVNHWHGITLLGATNSRIVNNTVIDVWPDRPGPAWIQIGNHKDGRPSSNNVVRNNVAMNFLLASGATTDDHNIKVEDPSLFFKDHLSFNMHLIDGAPAIDVGSPLLAPSIDRDGVSRPFGAAVDIGAYEWIGDTVPPGAPKRLRID